MPYLTPALITVSDDEIDEETEDSDDSDDGHDGEEHAMAEDSATANGCDEDIPDAFLLFTTLVFMVLTERAVPALLKITYGNLANAYFSLRDDSRAIEASDKAIVLVGEHAQSSDAKYFYRRAVARARQQASFSGMRDFSGALKDISRAHKLKPTDSSIANALADIKARVRSSRKTHARLLSRSMET